MKHLGMKHRMLSSKAPTGKRKSCYLAARDSNTHTHTHIHTHTQTTSPCQPGAADMVLPPALALKEDASEAAPPSSPPLPSPPSFSALPRPRSIRTPANSTALSASCSTGKPHTLPSSSSALLLPARTSAAAVLLGFGLPAAVVPKWDQNSGSVLMGTLEPRGGDS
eukprot:1154520-Pelagomonas_calceolata.AAC.6